MKRGDDVVAGVCLALAAVPPQIAGVLALAALLVLRRWRGLVAFMGTLALLTLISVAMIGWWLPDWIAGLFAYANYSFPVWALGLLEPPLLMVALVLFLGGLLWSSVRSSR
ncbi:MAG: hypothetical protein HC828_17380 [Blastochloris sp.]|nr:hypothetical protein [Blastochloris sp.]